MIEVVTGTRQVFVQATENGINVTATRNPAVVVVGGTGSPGNDAGVSFGLAASGPYAAYAAILPAPITIVGHGKLTAAASRGRAWTPCTGSNVWTVTKNGIFANEKIATPSEIAAARFATVTFPAGAAPAVWNYPTGGDIADGDALRVWESATPDSTQANTSLTFAG
jgi:hypothetical protein